MTQKQSDRMWFAIGQITSTTDPAKQKELIQSLVGEFTKETEQLRSDETQRQKNKDVKYKKILDFIPKLTYLVNHESLEPHFSMSDRMIADAMISGLLGYAARREFETTGMVSRMDEATKNFAPGGPSCDLQSHERGKLAEGSWDFKSHPEVKDLDRAINCLSLEVHESIAQDIQKKFWAVVDLANRLTRKEPYGDENYHGQAKVNS